MKHGNVTSVTYEEGVVYCGVRALRMDNHYPKVPVLRPHSGFIQVPEQKDKVAMESLDDGTLFITGVIEKESDTPDAMREGELSIQLDADTKLRFKEANSGDYNVNIEASGDLNINASGDVIIDGTPFSEHVHEYTDDETPDTGDGSGTSSTKTKTTEPPN